MPPALTQYEGFIASLSRVACRKYRGSFCEFDDYRQIGRMAFLKATMNWQPSRGSFPLYARASIRREIMNAALASHFPSYAPLAVKRIALKVHRMLGRGKNDQSIRTALNLSPETLGAIKTMLAPAIRGDMV